MSKICSKCEIELDPNKFGKDKSKLDGLSIYCKTCIQARNFLLRQSLAEYKRSYYSNPENVLHEKNRQKEYNTIEANKKRRNELAKNRRKSDPMFKLTANLRNRMNEILSTNSWRKNSKFSEYIGCSLQELKKHLESLFHPGMTWENHGDWHIDHKYPLSLAKNEQELTSLFHYMNLQPLWAVDNIRKSNKVA